MRPVSTARLASSKRLEPLPMFVPPVVHAGLSALPRRGARVLPARRYHAPRSPTRGWPAASGVHLIRPSRLLKNETSAAGPHWAAPCVVLSRARSAATNAPCVLALRVPSAP